jgi:hypothetical protein
LVSVPFFQPFTGDYGWMSIFQALILFLKFYLKEVSIYFAAKVVAQRTSYLFKKIHFGDFE